MPNTKPKRKAKARKLVDPKKTSAAAKTIIDANATQSPLLRLTPELRNRIYGLVLGGQGMHVGRDLSGPVLCAVCIASPFLPGADDKAFTPSAESRHRWYSHAGCGICAERYLTKQPRVPVSLSLLGVCKQIHQEAALLPFTLNTFLCTRLGDLAKFSGRLIAYQRPAVAHLDMCLDSSRLWVFKTDQARLAKLTGLKSLKITISVMVTFGRMQEVIERLQQAVDTVQGCCKLSGLKKVTIGFEGWDWSADFIKREPVPVGYWDWARGIEQQLLAG